ncbi:hypothetical protein [Streptomyces tropicalis]|uniref:Uncharacterized protein n=1 Tax=Streptomyces tropicalis TaxID=3034234 RepID=A0ABT6A299_9ACTN|nr:hypothetical protein [Streptomyces tropicalis]MDF3298759.1 hypothetical protein [Streptomyces tropicalis]
MITDVYGTPVAVPPTGGNRHGFNQFMLLLDAIPHRTLAAPPGSGAGLTRCSGPPLPAAHDTLVLCALAKDRADRYQTAEEMRDAIGKVLAGRATTVTLPPPFPPATVGHTQLPPAQDPRKERLVRRRRVRRALRAMVLPAAAVGIYVITGSHAAAHAILRVTLSPERTSSEVEPLLRHHDRVVSRRIIPRTPARPLFTRGLAGVRLIRESSP